jgi:imidazolonepropionase-like amidohydrolase
MARPGISNALAAGVDSIEHGVAIPDDLIDVMVAKGIYLCPTLTVTEYVAPGRAAAGAPIWVKMLDFHRDSFRRAVKKGVKVALGTDAGGFAWTENQAKEFTYMVRYGMTPMQAIQSATMVAAALLDQSKDLGELSPGHLADIVAVNGDPLQDVTRLEHVRFVMKGGQVFKNER